jgi:hypothetical protein
MPEWLFGSPERLFAGTDEGVFLGTKTVARWKALPSPMQDVWALAIDQHLCAGDRTGLLGISDSNRRIRPRTT